MTNSMQRVVAVLFLLFSAACDGLIGGSNDGGLDSGAGAPALSDRLKPKRWVW